uniref:BOS complex subunit TMEM147 n=1 Tax=Vannella robusta TaxID=1487602 RepID=A0A7S4IQ03_9EUKA
MLLAMTFIHFVNCVALTFGPLFVFYRSHKLREPQSLLYSGLFYLISQFAKLFLLATFVPSLTEDGSFHLVQELMIAYITVADLVCLYIFLNNRHIRGNVRSQLLYVALGWTAAESLLERLGPLWIGARNIEFQWTYLLLAVGGTISVFYFYAIASFMWLWTRKDLPPTLSFIVMGSTTVYCLLPVLFKYSDMVLNIGALEVVLFRAAVVFPLFFASKMLVRAYEKTKKRQ